MKHKLLLMMTICFVAFSAAIAARAQTTEFAYQGRLSEAGNPVTGTRFFRFTLFDQTGAAIAGAAVERTLTVTSGVFSTSLDFGAANFPGATRTLQIEVKINAGDAYTLLNPRQPITSAPYAIRTRGAAAADSLSAACVLCVTDAQITNLAGTKVTGSVANADNATTADNVTGIVQIANGGTGSATQNFVDLTTMQTVDGSKTFSSAVNTTAEYRIGGIRILGNAGSNNLFVGTNAGAFNTTGFGNAFVGRSAGQSNTIGRDNSFVGANAGNANTTGSGNLFVGRSAGFSNTTGDSNSFVGTDAGFFNTMGGSNSFVGASAGQSNTAGDSNSFVGAFAGQSNTTGGSNSFFGLFAGFSNTTGSNNTAVGQGANVGANNLTFATAIGSGATVSASNRVQIGREADTVNVPGTLTKAAGSFKIDHPLDPQNKTLSHSFVESPDMMNVYNGTITTNEQGEATVALPDYFEALNRDFRYQLTVIGQFAQVIVAEEITGNSFKIRTDKPGVKVSWQVTGIRRDKFAEDKRIPNTEEKPASEKGKCLYAPACGEKSLTDAPKP